MRKLLLFLGIDRSPVVLMTKRSFKAFSMFNKAIKKLEKLNSEIESHKEAHTAMIKQLQSDHDLLHTQLEKNTKLRDKLTEFTA